jgi:hypothetical protein
MAGDLVSPRGYAGRGSGARMTKKKKGQSKESRQMSYAFQRKGGAPLTKTELQEMLRDAVENTRLRQEAMPGAASEPDNEDDS